MADSILDKVLDSHHSDVLDHINPFDLIEELLKALAAREAQVIRLRFGIDGSKPQTLEKIGKSFDITRERVRQIERLSIAKIKEASAFDELIRPLENAVAHELIQYGGARSVDSLLDSFLASEHEPNRSRNIFLFLANHLLESISEVDHQEALPSWKMKHIDLHFFDPVTNELIDILILNQEPKPFDTIWEQFQKSNYYAQKRNELIDRHPLPNENVTDDHLKKCVLSCLEMSKKTAQNPFQQWGLSQWPSIKPKRMADKIYLILKQQGKPLHFNVITDLINKTGFDHKTAHAPTVHNELILDNRFVLVGRGIYALREWGYSDGVVSDVISDILAQAGQPLTRDEIVERVSQRRIVKRGTVYLSLSDRLRFGKTSDGKYFNMPAGPGPKAAHRADENGGTQ